jgi:hypothetical protein
LIAAGFQSGAPVKASKAGLRLENAMLIHPASPEEAVAHHGLAKQKDHANQER